MTPPPRATWADLGWHGLTRALLALQAMTFGASLLIYRVTGLHVDWTSDWLFLMLVGLLATLWMILIQSPGRHQRDWIVAESFAAAVVFLLLFQVTAPLQYGAVALGRPFVDPWLSAADGWLGIDVARLAEWTARHRSLRVVLNMTYATFVPQLCVPLIVLPLVRDRSSLWEYLWHLHVCIIVAIACSGLWPSACVFAYRRFEPLVPHVLTEQVTRQLVDLHGGRFHELRLSEMQGLISFPSFHAAGALLVTWALRRCRWWLWGVVALINVGLIAATVMLGLHYAVDLVGTAMLLGLSLWTYRRWGSRFLVRAADDGRRD